MNRFWPATLVKAVRSRIALSIVLGVVLATAFTFWLRTARSTFYFEITMRSSLPGSAQLYYDTGSGLNEVDSVRVPVQELDRAVNYRFRLPEGVYGFLRFDPTDQAGNTITLSRPRLVDGTGQLVRRIELSQLKAMQQIETFEATAMEVHLETNATDRDPILEIEFSQPVILKNFARDSWSIFTRRFSLSFLVTSAFCLLFLSILRLTRITPRAIHWGARTATWAANRPQQAVLAIAALFVILSCYPVVFFGKSFLSPNNGTNYLLYGKMPTVPGYKDFATDDPEGSDMGAAMWQSWPYSVIETRALFKDGELPLWNRYNATGLPLLGQGLSMCADPLQLVVLIGDGSSTAWDLKYLLAKFLFAVCIGLCVLQAVRHLPAALILTASAPFIGFFSFRYSHPAFFPLCYAPAVLLCWFKLIDSRPGKATAIWLGTMVLADWTLLNSGTVKEAYILFLMLNFCGLLALLLGNSIAGGKGRKLFQVFVVKILFVAISMPVWLTFFHALGSSMTVYDSGGAWQITPSLLIGLFDDIFYRPFNLAEAHLDPSLNFFALLALLWFLVSPGKADSNGLTRSLAITSLLALAFIYALVPSKWITSVPLLKNIVHIDNTFSCVAIVCLLVLAGFGIKAFWNDVGSPNFKRIYQRVMVLLLALVALYLGATEAVMRSNTPMLHLSGPIPKSAFFWGYSLSLILAVALTPWLGRFALLTRRAFIFQVVSFMALFVLLHWRHGMHLATPFDAYVMNPQRRVNLTADSSDALRLVKTRPAEPSRSIGLDMAFWPGYGGAVNIEQIDGPDPILNKRYRTLIDLTGAKLLFGNWRIGVDAGQLSLEPLVFNMLNVRYYLGHVSPNIQVAPSFKKIASLDLDVYESEHVWPRAFFTDELVAYEHETEFIELLKKGDGAPFAAVSNEEIAGQKALTGLAANLAPSAGRRVTPARDYVLTNNTTAFDVTASGPGVIVLTEAFVPRDFKMRLNGQPADYFRVNSAFKGVFVPSAGNYTVSYTFWPRYFTRSLLVSGTGLIALLGWLVIMAKGGVRRTPVS